MVSPELIRRYPFFGSLTHEELTILAQAGDEMTVGPGDMFFHDGEDLSHFYMVMEGAVAIVLELTDRSQPQPLAAQLTGGMTMKDITVSTVGTGEVFGWSALIPPTIATSGARALTPCKVIAFDCRQLRGELDSNCHLNQALTLKAAQVIRQRLRDMRIESMVMHAEKA